MNSLVSIKALFDLSHTAAAPLFQRLTYPWEALPEISHFILELGETSFSPRNMNNGKKPFGFEIRPGVSFCLYRWAYDHRTE